MKTQNYIFRLGSAAFLAWVFCVIGFSPVSAFAQEADSDEKVGEESALIVGSKDEPGLIRKVELLEARIKSLEDQFAANTNRLVPPGTIIAFGGHTNAIPPGWLLCNGKQVEEAEHPELFAAIGRAWGAGDTNSTFNLPDLQGYFLRGVSGDSKRDPEASGRGANNHGGNTNNMVGSVQRDAFQDFDLGVFSAEMGKGESTPKVLGARRWNEYLQHKTPEKDQDYAEIQARSIYRGKRHRVHQVDDGRNGKPRTSSETRPLNAYVNYIIKR